MPDPSVAEHRARILASVAPLTAPVDVPLAEALGRVLAADVTAALAVPPFDHAAMDGFAVRVADVAEVPVELPVTGVVAAGDPVPALVPGGAVRIMTGAEVPADADLVIPFEWTSGTDPVRILQTAAPGRHVRREGEDVAAGAVALAAGTRLGPAQVGLLTSVGRPVVPVRPRPRHGVVSTGAELVTGHVPDSNTATLAAAGVAAGAEVGRFGPVADDPTALRRQLLVAASQSDIVVTTGGISAGDHDVVKAALRDDPAFWFGPVAMKPGRPQGCGVLEVDGRRVPVVTLPGTPVAAFVSFHLYVVPALRVLAGTPKDGAMATLASDVVAGDRTVVLPGVYDDLRRVAPLPGHAGHSQGLLALAEVLLVVPPVERVIAGGEMIEVLALHPEEDPWPTG